MTKTIKKTKNKFGIKEEDIVERGIHLGHITSKFHPKMKPHIMGVKNNIHVLEPEKIIKKATEAFKHVESLVKKNKKILLVGTKIPIQDLVKKTAEECDIFYVNKRWLGGALTNFETISKRIKYFNEMEEKKEKGEFDKYTKKEQLDMDRELSKLEEKFGGIKNMKKLPDMVFVVDTENNEVAVHEARIKEITIMGLCDTNFNPKLLDYPIFGNDDSISSVEYFLEKLKEVILKNKKEQKNA